jgi:hypothetical protein
LSTFGFEFVDAAQCRAGIGELIGHSHSALTEAQFITLLETGELPE